MQLIGSQPSHAVDNLPGLPMLDSAGDLLALRIAATQDLVGDSHTHTYATGWIADLIVESAKNGSAKVF